MLKTNGLTISDTLCIEGHINVTVTASTTHNWNPTGLADTTIIRADATTAVGITGLQGGIDGRVIQIHNVGSTNTIRFYPEDTGSDAANRFISGATLEPGQCMNLSYDGMDSRWRTTSVNTNSSISNEEAGETANTSTTSTTYVLMDGMTLTPPVGTYLVLFSASGSGDSKDQLARYALFKDTTINSGSERHSHNVSGHQHVMDLGMNCQGIITVNGSESINVKYKTDIGVFTIYQRCLIVTRVG